MATKKATETKVTETGKVDDYMKNLNHPLANVLEALRKIILNVDKEIGEEIKWNAPTFFYTGPMRPSDPKEYKRYLVVSNVFKKDCIRLVFPTGAKIDDKSGWLEGDYADGRRLVLFYNMQDVKSKEKALKAGIKKWLKLLDK